MHKRLAAVGLLVTASSVPFFLRNQDDAPAPAPDHAHHARVDLKQKEIEYEKDAYPFIRNGLIALYEAEENQSQALAQGKIPDNPVDLRIAGFAPPGEELDDMGMGALQVIKRFRQKQPDNSEREVLANEHWEATKTGEILFPYYVRARVQYTGDKKDLYKPKAHLLFKTAMYQMVWIQNGKNPEPLIAQQFSYEDFDPKQGFNPMAQTELLVHDCVGCHSVTKGNFHAKGIFLEAARRKREINRGRLVQDWQFELPDNEFTKQPGRIEYLQWITKKATKGELSEQFVAAAEGTLKDFSPFNSASGMLKALREAKDRIPWIGNDQRVNTSGYGTYIDATDGNLYKRAVFGYYKKYNPNPVQAIPQK